MNREKENSASATARNLCFDLMRIIAMLYIIAFWHLQDYTSKIKYVNPATLLLTNCILGVFVFISGVILSNNDVADSIKSVV